MNTDVGVAETNDGFLRIEGSGIEAVPDVARHGRTRELAFLWAGAFVNYASLLTASLLTTFYGLGIWDGLAATIAGTLAGAVIIGLLSNTGPATGLPQIVFTRRIFGASGARAGAALTLFLAIGWFAVDCVIAAQAGSQLLGAGGSRPLTFALVIVVAGISVAVAIFGHRTISILEAYGSVAFAILAAALFAVLAPQVHWTFGPTAAGADYPGAFVLGFMTCFALVASWFPFASDYSRYLPAASSRRAVTFWPVVGVAAPMLLLGLFGLLLPTIDIKLAADQGVLAVIQKHAPGWVSLPFFAFVILGEIWANYLDVYTAGLVSLSMGLRLKRWQTALGCGLLGTAVAGFAVLVTDFHVAYQDFLILTYLWAPAWAAVVLLSFFAVKGGVNRRQAVAAWLAGTLLSLVFVNYPNLFASAFPNAHYPNQALVDGLHNADLSGLVSVGAAAIFFLGLRRLRAK